MSDFIIEVLRKIVARIDGNLLVFQGVATCTGEALQLPDQVCKIVTIQAEPTNVGYVYVGLNTTNADNHMATLSPGSSVTFTINNSNKLYAYGTAGDKICWGGEV